MLKMDEPKPNTIQFIASPASKSFHWCVLVQENEIPSEISLSGASVRLDGNGNSGEVLDRARMHTLKCAFKHKSVTGS